jgi:hypothetical protein
MGYTSCVWGGQDRIVVIRRVEAKKRESFCESENLGQGKIFRLRAFFVRASCA